MCVWWCVVYCMLSRVSHTALHISISLLPPYHGTSAPSTLYVSLFISPSPPSLSFSPPPPPSFIPFPSLQVARRLLLNTQKCSAATQKIITGVMETLLRQGKVRWLSLSLFVPWIKKMFHEFVFRMRLWGVAVSPFCCFVTLLTLLYPSLPFSRPLLISSSPLLTFPPYITSPLVP